MSRDSVSMAVSHPSGGSLGRVAWSVAVIDCPPNVAHVGMPSNRTSCTKQDQTS
jgi:hypothetical protein